MRLDPVTYVRYEAVRSMGVPALTAWNMASPRRAPAAPTEPALPTLREYGRTMADRANTTPSAIPVAHILPALRDAKPLPKTASKRATFALYVATMPDGSKRLQKFNVPDGRKPDAAYGFNVTCLMARAVPIAGFVEHMGARIPDKHFEWHAPDAAKKPSPTARLKAICKALNEGEIDAALQMARDEQ